MGLTDEQIAFIERQLRDVDAGGGGGGSADDKALQRRESLSLACLFPPDWREQAKRLTFTPEENRAIDNLLTSLRSYREPDQPLVAQRVVERLERVARGHIDERAGAQDDADDNLRRFVFVPLLQLSKLERDLTERAERALTVDNDDETMDAERLPDVLARLVAADISRVNRKNEFLDARTLARLKETGHEAVEAAKKQLALMDELFGPRDARVRFVPDLDENGVLVLSVCSRVRRRGEAASRSRDKQNEDDDDDEGEDAELAARRRRDATSPSLDTALFSILWQVFKFVVWRSLKDGLPLAVEALLLFYQSQTNSALLVGQYKNINFEGYQNFTSVPFETFLFGDYGTGLYGMHNPKATNNFTQVPSVSLNLYKELEDQVQSKLLDTSVLALGRERSFLGVLLTAIVVRTVVIKVMQLATSGGNYLYQRMLSRVRRQGGRGRARR